MNIPVLAQDETHKPFPEDTTTINLVNSQQFQENIPKAPQTIQSPIAASLGSYGEIPVSLYTGKPEINVDLHTVTSGNITVPVSLNYDASGVRPDMHAGWTGLNFNLSNVYSITRTVKDGPDEFNRPNSSLGELGYLFSGSGLNNGANWALRDTIIKTATTVSIASGSTSGTILVDTEPDEYSFSIPGLSGKFYYGSDRKWKIQCDRPVKLEWITTQNTHLYTPFTPPSQIKGGNPWSTNLTSFHYMEHLEGFVIIDEFGTRYVFGGSDMAFMEYSIDFFNQGKSSWICNAWYLKSITPATGQSAINFTYERGDFVAQMYFSVYNKTARVNGGSWFGCADWSSTIGAFGAYNGKLISPIYLKEIAADNFRIKYTSTVSNELKYSEDIFTTYVDKMILDGYSKLDFLTFLYDCYYPVFASYPGSCGSPTLTSLLAKLKWRKLDKIEIQNGNGATIKEFALSYINDPTSRLMLDKIQEKSGTSVIPPYQFTYFNGTGLSLPGYSKSHTDHWGFNNGLIINTLTDFNAYASYGTTFRSPATDVRYLKLGIIASIQFPTGGVTRFVFEPHTYSKEVMLKRWDGEDPYAANRRAGGLRIKEIHTYDNVKDAAGALVAPVVSKRYYYQSAFNPAAPDTTATNLSSGILGGKAQYYWPDYKPLPSNAGITVEEEIFSTQSVLPVSENTMGSHIGYSQVIERSSTQGWVVHKFSNFDNGYRDDVPNGFLQLSVTPYQPYNSKAFQRGKLLARENYFQNGNAASKTTLIYDLVGALNDYSARSVKTSVTILCNTSNVAYEGTAYLNDCRKFLITQENNYSYDQDNAASAVNSRTYTYWPNGQLYISAQNDSRSRTIKTWYKYPPNLTVAPYSAMTLANIIATPYEVFQYTGTEAAPAAIKLQTVTFNTSNPYLPQKVETKLGASGPTTTDIEFTYDGRGNVSTYKEKNGLTTKLEYFGTGTGKVDLLNKRILANGASQAQTTVFDHLPAVGVSSITDPNAKAIGYDYDAFSRLITVKNISDSKARASYCYNYAGQLTPCTLLAPSGSIGASGLVLIAESDNPLPVTLAEFEAVKREKVVELSWSTTAETNSESFEIQRSNDAKQWISLGVVAARGESSELQNYTFTDTKPQSGENLYRLKMIDRATGTPERDRKDGTFAYSRIRSVVFDQNGEVVLYPNPITIGERLNLLTDNLDKVSAIKIFDTNGKLVLESTATSEINTSGFAAGLYMVQITYTDGSLSTHRVVKQ
ncbi:T9SS type A sorting domain-containing protein [Dyadobacter sp. NIV53]|uniref:T9SS type A sorting domain-containing protein n=1 Tax=Dyadobacter sp. NIV53 TaxID=2861765 RepID=UPI001C86CE2B|nr:T9SS type A sorting domain-containing protein [Dyadobacter sp. NIV53]